MEINKYLKDKKNQQNKINNDAKNILNNIKELNNNMRDAIDQAQTILVKAVETKENLEIVHNNYINILEKKHNEYACDLIAFKKAMYNENVAYTNAYTNARKAIKSAECLINDIELSYKKMNKLLEDLKQQKGLTKQLLIHKSKRNLNECQSILEFWKPIIQKNLTAIHKMNREASELTNKKDEISRELSQEK